MDFARDYIAARGGVSGLSLDEKKVLVEMVRLRKPVPIQVSREGLINVGSRKWTVGVVENDGWEYRVKINQGVRVTTANEIFTMQAEQFGAKTRKEAIQKAKAAVTKQIERQRDKNDALMQRRR